MSINSRFHASLYSNCHYPIVHASFNLNNTYPQPYQRLKWDLKKADKFNIRKALDLIKKNIKTSDLK